ncbi:unnamed protein product, partial [Prorocentrum cordatum]
APCAPAAAPSDGGGGGGSLASAIGAAESGAAAEKVAFVTLATGAYLDGALVLCSRLRERLPAQVDVVAFSDGEVRLPPGVLLRPLASLPEVGVPAGAGEPVLPQFDFCWAKLG